MPVFGSTPADASAATTDIITVAEAKQALNIDLSDTTYDDELAFHVTAVSLRLDDYCGAIVKRTVTDEEYIGGKSVIALRQAPASNTATTTITAVTEYSAGTAQVLAAETLTTSTAYDYSFDAKTGLLTRRSSWSTLPFAYQGVKVTYVPGRYTSTAAVDRKFKQAAQIMLEHLWRQEQGGGSETFPDQGLTASGIPTFFLPNAVMELLSDERKPPVVA